MKKIFGILSLAIIFASCSKEKQPSPASPAEKKLMEIKNLTNPSDTRTYNYDGDKVIKITSSTRYSLFDYSPSKLEKKDFDINTNALISRSEYDLDATGKVTVQKYFYPSGQPGYTATYTYDAAGYLINEKTVFVNGEVTEARYSISGGNAVHEDYYTNGVLDDATDYIYDPAVVSKMNFTMESNDGMKNLFGICYKNELVGYKRYDGNGVLQGHSLHAFQYDSDGYPTSKLTTNQLTGKKTEYQYKYQ